MVYSINEMKINNLDESLDGEWRMMCSTCSNNKIDAIFPNGKNENWHIAYRETVNGLPRKCAVCCVSVEKFNIIKMRLHVRSRGASAQNKILSNVAVYLRKLFK